MVCNRRAALLENGVRAQVLPQLLLELADLVIEMSEVRVQRRAQDTGGLFQIGAVAFGLAHPLERVDAAHQGLELTLLGWRWCPERWLVGDDKTGNKRCVGPVGFSASQFALGESVGAGRVNHADVYAALV